MAKQVKPTTTEFDEWLGEETEVTTEEFEIEEFPVIPLRDTVVYPRMVAPLFVGREKSVKAIEAAMANNQRLVTLAQLDQELEDPDSKELYTTGTEVLIGRTLRMPDGTTSIWVQGQRRVRVQRFTQVNPYLAVEVTPIRESAEDGLATEALIRAVLALFEKVVQNNRNIPDDAYVAALNADEPSWLADLVASIIDLPIEKRQELLETPDVTIRLQKLSVILAGELDVLELQNKISSQVQSEVDRTQREYYLREQMRVIQNELGENDPFLQDVKELSERLSKLSLSDDVRARAEKELNRLNGLPSASPEVGVIRTYIDWILTLPWNAPTEDKLDITEAAKVLDATHYGLPKAKERILEHLAVRKLAADKMKNPILCFVGPPGTGKTSLGKSIAQALGRKFVRVSLGGIRDEAEIRGHRRTYIGAMPGRIIQTMRNAGSSNPVFMLDEIDKVGSDFRGDPSAALLEVLDPEQNYAFSDHYLELPYDLSRVMFITTANMLDPIPPALLDRMEVIEFLGYVEEDKIKIARQFLIPHQLEQNGVTELHFADSALNGLIREYTQEAGVRNLEREIANICRKVARRIAEGKPAPKQVVRRSLVKYLGPPHYMETETDKQDQVGVATGLAWTESGGDTLLIEVTILNGKGNLLLTGQLGEVMQESAQAALSYARSRVDELGIGNLDFDKIDIHIHVPEGAVPKDGPSAGITIATALISVLTGRAVHHNVAMTGEITLRGKVLPIGGLREKLLAARRAGIDTLLIPLRNKPDLIEVPKKMQKGMRFVFIQHMDDVLPVALADKPVAAPKPRRSRSKKAEEVKPEED
ncbi:MAG: endopeptidase La [Chloroflexi bacterium]|nr:endopeptidase La [Chloroflexota bacterium]